MDKTYELAKKIVSKGQIAVKFALQSILTAKDSNLQKGLDYEAELFGNCCGTKDFVEGTQAFLEKRKPNFQNK